MGQDFSDYSDIQFGYECDLHHFHPGDTKVVVNEFIRQAIRDGRERIRLVHGKGKSVKKRTAYSILEEHPDVHSFVDEGHNWGATIITLKVTPDSYGDP